MVGCNQPTNFKIPFNKLKNHSIFEWKFLAHYQRLNMVDASLTLFSLLARSYSRKTINQYKEKKASNKRKKQKLKMLLLSSLLQ
jgi:hypothetical protein